ncbi:MAG: hypothetical protein FD189_2228 [Elusimicrobia bacterium]|nr:MAG: hypothetical protein FD154_2241 [Elusimicrobiota bacterium]KAF0153878.1 MAG: hypothetical protein FD189_2228 [Elusimicrobiota bacterium]
MKIILASILAVSVFCRAAGASGFEAELRQAEDNFAGVKLAEGLELPLPVPSASMPEGVDGMPDIFGYFEALKPAEPAARELAGFDKAAAALTRPAGEVLYRVELEKVKNAYLRTARTFKTSRGTTVHVSGSKASNCPDGGNGCKDKEKFFLVLTTDKGESFFARAMDIVNWGIFMSGSRTFTIDGEKYTVKVKANASTPENSMLEVKGPKGVVLKASLKDLGDAVAAKGVDVRLGKSYKLAYGNEIVQGPQGARFTQKMLVLMIPFPVQDASNYFILAADDIKPSGVMFPELERGHGFRMNGGTLEIFRLN